MGRRVRTQLPDDDVVVELSSHRAIRKQRAKRGAKPPKQTHRQRAAEDQTREQGDSTLKRLLPTEPLSQAQADHLHDLDNYRLVLATGPAGTGKTFCPIAHALDQLSQGRIERIICLRPTVEAGGSLGFLPGSLAEKILPFFAPIRRSIIKKLGNAGFAERWMKSAMDNGTLVFASIQHLRGETLENCFVHLDEAQNCSYAELKLVVTRMGEGSRFSLCGDADQTDIGDERSGWRELVARLAPLVNCVAVTRYAASDVVRDPLLRQILPHL